MRNTLIAVVVMAAILCSGCTAPSSRHSADGPALAHDVYFTLHDNSPAAKAALVQACEKYLRDHPGVTFFAAGQLVEAHARDVNVRDWDVGLHIVFQDKASHDLYQEAEAHHQFIEENRENWKTVRVFDTYVE
ncbi:MAG: Dabb family protein [Phycisphaerales bacterium]|nr:MAG: Dabb family protein [Phycisphaerales bacterium]